MLMTDVRRREFARLDECDHAYLDYTGAALAPVSLIDAHAAMLRDAVLGNPHSESGASVASSALLEEAREHVRRHFHADEYAVCFTPNATGAIRLVAESFAFGPHAGALLAVDNHNSVNGIREYARRSGAPVRYVSLGGTRVASVALDGPPGLFAFPAQSNFSGAKYPLELVRHAQGAGHTVLLDAAAFVPTNVLDLRAVSPDFVAVSLYKMFGYPTGIGVLLARHEALSGLRRPWFAGGTVEYVRVSEPSHVLREGAEGFEDGTVNFLSMGAVTAGLRWLDALDVERIGAHAGELARGLRAMLTKLRHHNGQPMIELYGPSDESARGAIATFNVLDERGATIPHETVEHVARDVRVSVRGGCFCNPGAAEEAGLGFGAARQGAVRASLGVANDLGDVERLVDVVIAVATRRAPNRESRTGASRAMPLPRPDVARRFDSVGAPE
jgi:selenocysteine lyase/cysteine desulfurase